MHLPGPTNVMRNRPSHFTLSRILEKNPQKKICDSCSFCFVRRGASLCRFRRKSPVGGAGYGACGSSGLQKEHERSAGERVSTRFFSSFSSFLLLLLLPPRKGFNTRCRPQQRALLLLLISAIPRLRRGRAATIGFGLFYNCSYQYRLSSNDRRDRRFTGF